MLDNKKQEMGGGWGNGDRISYFRTEEGLSDSLKRLHSLWHEIRNSQVVADQIVRARETAAMVATARWM